MPPDVPPDGASPAPGAALLDLDFPALAGTPVVGAFFECSLSTSEVHGSIAVTTDAVFLGTGDGLLQIDAADVVTWSSQADGSAFSLLIGLLPPQPIGPLVTYLSPCLQESALRAIRRTFGPEEDEPRTG